MASTVAQEIKRQDCSRGGSMAYLVSPDSLPEFQSGQAGITARVLQGAAHGIPGISIILNQTAMGDGAPWHRHAYDELFVIQEGRCVFFLGDETVEAGPGQIVLVPATLPHSFRNPGPEALRMIAVHAAPVVMLERVSGASTGHEPTALASPSAPDTG
jgi:mannose-6-phosphate isomerase-like protein (cupin superfamily)